MSEYRFLALKPEEAKHYLNQMIEGYFQGMSEPLPLFCRSGWAWLVDCFDKETGEIDFREEVQQSAENKLMEHWLGTHDRKGESADHYVQRAFRQVDQSLLERMKRETKHYLLPMARYSNGSLFK